MPEQLPAAPRKAALIDFKLGSDSDDDAIEEDYSSSGSE